MNDNQITHAPAWLERIIVFLIFPPWRQLADQAFLAVTITLVTLALFGTWPQIVLAFPQLAQ